MLPLSRRVAQQALVLGLLVASSPSAPAEPAVASIRPSLGSPVLTLLDYFQAGRDRAEGFVAERARSSGHDLEAMLRHSRSACVRIEVRYNVHEGAYQAYTASGVLVSGGRRVLTAGHVVPADFEDGVIEVTLSDGRSFEAQRLSGEYEVFATGDEDWGLLELLAPPDESLPSLKLAGPRIGQLAFVLGYPSDLGIEPGGRIAPGFAHARAALDPLLFVGRVQHVGPVDLTPVAGCVPLGGASGAPVVDEDGRLLGVFVSVAQSTREEGVAHSYQVARVDAVQRALGGALGRSGT